MTVTRTLCIALALLVLLAALACMSSSKEDVVREMLDCQQERDPLFEESMMIMFPAPATWRMP